MLEPHLTPNYKKETEPVRQQARQNLQDENNALFVKLRQMRGQQRAPVCPPMSVTGTEQTSMLTMSMSASGGKADISDTPHKCPLMTHSGHGRSVQQLCSLRLDAGSQLPITSKVTSTFPRVACE